MPLFCYKILEKMPLFCYKYVFNLLNINKKGEIVRLLLFLEKYIKYQCFNLSLNTFWNFSTLGLTTN